MGVEPAEALVCAGGDVDVVEGLRGVLGTVDEPIAALAQAELERHTTVRLGARLEAVDHGPTPAGGLTAGVDGQEIPADLVLISTGVRPATDLLVQAGARAPPGRPGGGGRGGGPAAPRVGLG